MNVEALVFLYPKSHRLADSLIEKVGKIYNFAGLPY